jgi:hypothetical protein
VKRRDGMKIPKKISKLVKRKDERGRVEWDDFGFTIFDGDRVAGKVRWNEIEEIFAFKEDHGIWDDICLGFAIDEKGTFWTVSEEFVGYKPLLGELERRFPGINTDWFADVAFPAFAANRKSLWRKSQQSSA